MWTTSAPRRLSGDLTMQLRVSQSGMGFVSIVFVLGVCAFFLLSGLKLYPGYYEAFGVRTSMNGLATESEIGTMTKAALWKALEKRLDINAIQTARVRELKKQFAVSYDKETKQRLVRLAYEWRTPMFGNLDAVLSFDHPIYVKR